LKLQDFEVRSPGSLQFHFWDSLESAIVIPSPPRRKSMRSKKQETTGSGDLFRARLEQIINEA
jgi:hypothetical protein